jgi:hypothetical protein
MKCVILILVFSVFVVTLLYGQIVIDWTEIPQDLGTQFSHNGVDTVTVDLIGSGGPHAWQFTAQPPGSQNVDALVVPKASTPFGDSFPNSNLVYMITEGSDTLYEYLELTSSFGNNLGQGIISSTTVFFRYNPVDTNPLPVVYGSSRNYHAGYTIDLGSNMELRVDSRGFESIDAWGTVTIGYGTFDCLRVCRFDTTESTMLYNSIPIAGDTTEKIIQDFLLEDYGVAAHILSYEGETNPNFTNASFLSRLTDFSSGIAEEPAPVSPGVKLTCSPNPFITSTTISLRGISDHQNTRISELHIYDITGRLVRQISLLPFDFSLGAQAIWDGKDEEGRVVREGIYFISVDGSVKQKIVKIK